MPFYWVCYFNLRDGVSEEELGKFLKKFFSYLQKKVEGVGPGRLYRHHLVGANPRMYQIHVELKDFGAWDRIFALYGKDAELVKLAQEWRSIMDEKTHYDEHIREIPL